MLPDFITSPRAQRLGLAGAGALALAALGVTQAADHAEAPLAAANLIADIDDLYAWHVPSANKLVTVMTLSNLPGQNAPTIDDLSDDILYGFHIDNNNDDVPEFDIWVRFGPDSLGNWGMQVENLPGSNAPVVGPVESIVYTDAGRYVFAGLRDDPFFFDLTGFHETLQTATVSFDSRRDDFAGTNVLAIVLEMDLQAALGGHQSLRVWGSTASRDL